MSIGAVEGMSWFDAGAVGQAGGAGALGNSLAAGTTTGTPSVEGTDFGSMLTRGIDALEGFTDNAANLSVKAATGDLSAIHDYTVAATQAQVATQLTVAVRDKALQSFQTIMQMQV